ncbi:MAG: class I SAM-dependent methyltransferase [Candidatus Rokubacteria bacterium]|nr:class I SAM-dependent methyltransferase [Candidatus Rokubacteria bacterium]
MRLQFLRSHRPTRALEIGSLFGYSAILIAGALPTRGRLTCIEANGYLARFVELNVAEAGLARRVRVFEGGARRVIPRLRTRFDFVLIDATKEQYLDLPPAGRAQARARRRGGCGQHKDLLAGAARLPRPGADVRPLREPGVRLRRGRNGGQPPPLTVTARAAGP